MGHRLRRKPSVLVVAALALVLAAVSAGSTADSRASRADDPTTLSLNTTPRESIACRESGLKPPLLDSGYSRAQEENNDERDLGATNSLWSSQPGQCSTDVILATFFKSRYCSSGTLVVAASNSLGSAAHLELVGYGPMIWDGTARMWVIRVRNIETNPGVVIVEGAGCSAQEEIMGVPYGCDARIGPDSNIAEQQGRVHPRGLPEATQ